MPDLETAPPATQTETLSPWQTKLAEAFKTQPEGSDETPPVAKEKAPAKSKPSTEKIETKTETTKTGTPKELFKKSGAAETKQTPPAESETKSAFDDIAEPVFKDEKGKRGWDAQRTEGKKWESAAKTHEAKVKELETKLAEYEPLKAQLAERDARLAEQSELVARVRLQDHPEFKREFIDGRAALMKRAQTIIEESGGDAKTVERALNLSGKARVEALREAAGELDNFQSARLGRAIDELTDLDERAAEKLNKAKETYAETQEKERQREIETRDQKMKSRRVEFQDTVRRLRGNLEVLNKADGHDDWNGTADRIVKESQDAVEANPNLDIEAEILARCIPAYRDLFLQADKKVEDLEKKLAEREKELKEIHGKSPSLTSRGGGGDGGADGKPKRPFMESLKTTVGEG